jgi:site-specific DNA-cytosine methylase
MTSLDVFSCIGCHAIGLSRAGIATVAFCEINPFRRARISTIFPERPIHHDIRSWSPPPPHSDIIIGGPPCQKTSKASAIHGYRSGDTLWPHMLSVGIAVGSEWFVVEQPPGNAPWEAQVSNDLSASGYEVARIEFGACDVGAPYIRRRVFLVACTSLPRLEVAWLEIPSAIDIVKRTANARGDWDPDKLESIPVDACSAGEHGSLRRELIEALGDSNPPHMAEVIGRAIMATNSAKS